MDLMESSTELPLDLYEHSPCGFHSLDAKGVFLRINQTELSWLGYTREEVIGRMSLNDILTLEGQRLFTDNFPRLKKSGVLRNLEFDFVRKDGTTLPVLVSATAVWNPDGSFAMSRTVAHDLTSRRQAENRFRSILEAAPDAILICNRSGTITQAGGQIEKLFGYRAVELNGAAVQTLLPERLRNSHEGHLERYFHQPVVRTMGPGKNLVALRKDGDEVPVEISLSPLQEEGGVSALAIVRDVTERESTQDKLQRSEDRYRSVVDAMAEGVVVQEGDGRISAWNASALRILGLTEDQIMGRTSADPCWKAIHEDGSPFPGETHPSMVALRTGKRQSNVCMGVHRPHGGITWVLINAEPILDSQAAIPRAVVTTFTDITERKKLEEELSQTQRLDAIGGLAGGIAHDFNNIVGVILGHCDLMAATSAKDEAASRHVDAIRKSANHAANFTRQLLAFSRKQVMRIESLDLNEVIRSLAEMLKRLIGENVELELNLATELVRVRADRGQIEQVLLNLLVNARDAMPKGGRLTIATANVELGEAVGGRTPVDTHAYAMFSVFDTGHGMDEKTVSRVFEPFFTTKEMGRGTGLGLSIIYGIVQQSNGHISVLSKPGQGTTFKVYLPRAEGTPEVETRTEGSPQKQAQGGSETILLVEDDEAVREMVLFILKTAGYKILTSGTAREALALCESHSGPIALLLSDVVLRGEMGGPTLAQKVASIRQGIKVLFMSGYSASFIAGSADSSRIGELIEKPFSSKELMKRVRQVLDSPS